MYLVVEIPNLGLLVHCGGGRALNVVYLCILMHTFAPFRIFLHTFLNIYILILPTLEYFCQLWNTLFSLYVLHHGRFHLPLHIFFHWIWPNKTILHFWVSGLEGVGEEGIKLCAEKSFFFGKMFYKKNINVHEKCIFYTKVISYC